MRKLARTSMPAFRRRLLQEQGGKCPLCLDPKDMSIQEIREAVHNGIR